MDKRSSKSPVKPSPRDYNCSYCHTPIKRAKRITRDVVITFGVQCLASSVWVCGPCARARSNIIKE